jgi:hypothetical protein
MTARYEAIQLALLRTRAEICTPAVAEFGDAVVQAALHRILQRAAQADITRMMLEQRLPRWRREPEVGVGRAPIIEADEVEQAIVALLAATAPRWSFSSTPNGRIFVGRSFGYHRERSREYVVGLSDVLDTCALVVEQHRSHLGGRIYATRRHIECAECRQVIAWVNDEGSRSAVSGRCR